MKSRSRAMMQTRVQRAGVRSVNDLGTKIRTLHKEYKQALAMTLAGKTDAEIVAALDVDGVDETKLHKNMQDLLTYLKLESFEAPAQGNSMYEIMWTTAAQSERDKLSDELAAEADRAVSLIATDPMHEGTHPLPGEPNVRQLVTNSHLCITYTKIGSLTLIVVLQLFTELAV